MQYTNLGDYLFVPKKIMKSNKVSFFLLEFIENFVQPCTIRCQKLFKDLDVYSWMSQIFECLLIQPMRIKVGFSFLTRHPLNEEIGYMYAAPELAFAEAVIENEVKTIHDSKTYFSPISTIFATDSKQQLLLTIFRKPLSRHAKTLLLQSPVSPPTSWYALTCG